MNVEYSRRALADVESIAAYYWDHASPRVARAIEVRIRAVVDRLRNAPESARRQVVGRKAVRVAPLVRYPFKIFYTVDTGTLTILHIRHSARRPWVEER